MIHQNNIIELIDKSISVKEKIKEKIITEIIKVAEVMIASLKNKNKLLVCGNGGSAADSQHFVAELVGRFVNERQALPALALTVNTSTLTAWANDYSYQTVFSRQIEALGENGDILFGISTSGNAENVLEAMKKAKEKGMVTIGLTGNRGGKIRDHADYNIIIPDTETYRIQESHIMIIHILCYLIEKEMF